MSRAEFANLVGIVATAVTFVQILPQIVRLIRTGHVEGVSPAWAAGGATINLGWLAYVIEGRFWVTIPSIIVAIVSFVLALFLLYRNGASIRAGLLMSGAIALGCVVIQQAAGWTVLGTVLGLSNGLYLG
ncbi:MAG: PQ-loop domain-containing transporter, partial [Acidimicrobiaceae bacterium]|nr:PQ-loop domain-containing transporter [Acidimicrobiaceae bacterium]